MEIFDYDNVLLLPRKCRVDSRSECDTSVPVGLRRFKLLTRGQEYTDQGHDDYEERYRERVLRALSQRAAKFGMQMVPIASVEQTA